MNHGTHNIVGESDVLDWLGHLQWDDPEAVVTEIENVLSDLIGRSEERHDNTAPGLYHAALDWLDKRQDPHTGVWGRDIEAGLIVAARLSRFYGYVHRPMRAMVALADQALASFPSAGVTNAQHLSRLLRFIQAKSHYRVNDIDEVIGAPPVPHESVDASLLSWPWMREPRGGSARFSRRAEVGVVVTCYNLGEYLFEALDSIAAQTLHELELVIVNDGSTCRFTNAYLHYLQDRGYQVIHQGNAGLAEARNNGIRTLSSSYICCFDADDLMHPEWLESASSVLRSEVETGYVSCYYTTFDNDHAVYKYDHPRYPEMLVENQTVGVSVFRRNGWERSGGYHRDFKGMEDWDFWLSLLDLGYRGTVIPEVLFYYRTRAGSMYAATRNNDTYTANIALLMTRHQTAFQTFWQDIVRLRARQFVELLNVRSAESQSYQREITQQQSTIRGLDTACNHQQKQVDLWQRTAAEETGRVKQLEGRIGDLEHTNQDLEHTNQDLSTRIAQLEREKHELQEQGRTSLVAIEAWIDRPGLMVRSLRNVLLLAASMRLGALWKNIPLGLAVLRRREARLLWSEHFDSVWYRRKYIDVTRSGASPLLHFLFYAQTEGRGASAAFDSEFYLQRHPDVRKAGVNPLLHYCLFGAHEKRTIAPPEPGPALFEPSHKRTFRSFRAAATHVNGGPLITVVIPCFNYGRYLAESLRSVEQQTLPQVDLVVVEGGSNDGVTPEMVRELERTRSQRARFLYRPEPHLTGDNRNYGITEAATKYVCCLDADDMLKATYLEVGVFLAETYGYHLVYPSVQAFGGDDFIWSLRDANPDTIVEFNQVSTVAIFQREAWKEVNGYRDFGRTTEHVAEDWEFWVRLLRTGFQAKCIPQALHMYRVHTAGLWHGERSSVEYQREKLTEANRDILASEPSVKPLLPAPHAWASLLQPAQAAQAILLALPFVITGGAERIFEAIIRSETAKGRKVIVITTLVLADTMKDAAEHFQTLTPHFYALPALFGEQLQVWDDFASYLIDQYSVDLIMIAGCDYMYHALPHLTSAFPDLAIVDQLFNDEVHFPTNRHYAQYIDMTIVPSPAFADRIVHEFGEMPDKAAVIPHGVHIHALPDAKNIVEARRRSGLPSGWEEMFIVGFFGRMSPEKAPVDYVEIAGKLVSERNMRFVMTGEGPELQRVRALIRDYGLADRIFTPGFVDNPHDLMVAVDAVVVPSRLDGMPLVVMESQSLAKPVVASRVGSIPVMIEDGQTGLLCQSGDIDGFANNLRELQASPETCVRIGRAARKSVEAHYSATAMIQRYQEAFQKARSARVAASNRG